MSDIIKDLNKLTTMYGDSGNFINHLEIYTNDHKEQFSTEYAGFQAISSSSIEIINQMLSTLKYADKSAWQGYYGEQYILLLNTIPLLYGSYKSLNDGYYTTASLSLKASIEALLRVYFISYHKENYDLIFGEKAKNDLILKGAPISKYPIFNARDFIKSTIKNEDLYEIYDTLSDESNGNLISTIQHIQEITEGNYDIYTNMQGALDLDSLINLSTMIYYAIIKYIDDILLKNTDLKDYIDSTNIIQAKDFLIKILKKAAPSRYIEDINAIMKDIQNLG